MLFFCSAFWFFNIKKYNTELIFWGKSLMFQKWGKLYNFGSKIIIFELSSKVVHLIFLKLYLMAAINEWIKLNKITGLDFWGKFQNLFFLKLHLTTGINDWLKVTVMNFWGKFLLCSKWVILGPSIWIGNKALWKSLCWLHQVWERWSLSNSINKEVNIFDKIMKILLSNYIPLKTIMFDSRDPAPINKDAKHFILDKNQACKHVPIFQTINLLSSVTTLSFFKQS